MGIAQMRAFLKKKPESKTDWAYILKDHCWRPVKSYRKITKGKCKGGFEVTLFYPEGKKRIVDANHTRFIDCE